MWPILDVGVQPHLLPLAVLTQGPFGSASRSRVAPERRNSSQPSGLDPAFQLGVLALHLADLTRRLRRNLDDLGVVGRIMASGRSRTPIRKYKGMTVLGTSEVNPDAQEPSCSTPYTRTIRRHSSDRAA